MHERETTTRALRHERVARTVFAMGCALGVFGCSAEPTRAECETPASCGADHECVRGRCIARDADAGSAADASIACGPGALPGPAGCRADCGDPASVPCADTTVCDFLTGACVPAGDEVLGGSGETCASGTRCLPGTECGLDGRCEAAPPCGSLRCTLDGTTCWGSSCAATRPVASCAPAPLDRMNARDFLRGADNGITDLELDDACNAYAVTVISGADYLRQLSPDGTLTEVAGVTNLNMGEVAVLRPYADEFATEPGEVALTYTCCLACDCIATDPQGVARLDRDTSALPMAIVAEASTGRGPFGSVVLDSGPFGLTWGRDRTLYVGNAAEVGDFVRADLTTGTTATIRRFAERVHASATYGTSSLLVAVAGGEVSRVSTDGAWSETFAELEVDVTSLVRDPFLPRVYVSLRDGRVVALALDGTVVEELVGPGQAGRVAYSPDGALYYLRTGWRSAFSIERIELPQTLD